MPGDVRYRSVGLAWVTLTLALAAHVTDEAMNDFLAVYNPVAMAIRSRFPFVPLPVFSFPWWLTGLILAVLALLVVSPLVFRGRRWLVRLSFPFGLLMFANGLGHIAYSLYTGTFMPGVWSSPLLLASSVWLFLSARRTVYVASS